MTRVSICIATYNGENYIKEQLDSIIAQISLDDEIIISDDCSTDKTISIIKSYNDDRIKIYYNNGVKGPTYNFENALICSLGKFIMFSDQDDIWEPNKISVILNLLESFDLILHDASLIDYKGKLLNQSYFSLNNSKKGIFKNIVKNSYLGCCMAFRRDVLVKATPFPSNLIAHDIWIGIIAELHHNVKHSNASLIKYRKHSNNVTNSGGKSQLTFFFKLEYRLILIFQLFIRSMKILLK